MRNIGLVLASGAALMLTACEAGTSDAVTAADGEAAEYTIDPVTRETGMTIRGERGETTLRSGARVPVSLPAGFSLFPGSTVVSNSLVAQPGGQGTMITYEAAAPAEAVIAHYRAQAEAAGFAIKLEMNTNGSLLVGGARDTDGASFSVTATTGDAITGGLTTGQIVLGTKTGG